MPGPMSAPNGDHKLTDRPRPDNRIVKSGKTALKRKEIKHATVEGRIRRVANAMKEFRRQQKDEQDWRAEE